MFICLDSFLFIFLKTLYVLTSWKLNNRHEILVWCKKLSTAVGGSRQPPSFPSSEEVLAITTAVVLCAVRPDGGTPLAHHPHLPCDWRHSRCDSMRWWNTPLHLWQCQSHTAASGSRHPRESWSQCLKPGFFGTYLLYQSIWDMRIYRDNHLAWYGFKVHNKHYVTF